MEKLNIKEIKELEQETMSLIEENDPILQEIRMAKSKIRKKIVKHCLTKGAYPTYSALKFRNRMGWL